MDDIKAGWDSTTREEPLQELWAFVKEGNDGKEYIPVIALDQRTTTLAICELTGLEVLKRFMDRKRKVDHRGVYRLVRFVRAEVYDKKGEKRIAAMIREMRGAEAPIDDEEEIGCDTDRGPR